MKDAQERLAQCIRLLNQMPVQSAASDLEPWAKIHIIDWTKIIEVAHGLTDPDEWVSEYCGKSFGHSPHHWSEYRDGQIPLRVAHWCNGEQFAS